MLNRAIKTLWNEIRIASKNNTAVLHMALRTVATVRTGKNVNQELYCLHVLCIQSKSDNRTQDTYILWGGGGVSITVEISETDLLKTVTLKPTKYNFFQLFYYKKYLGSMINVANYTGEIKSKTASAKPGVLERRRLFL